MDRIHQSFFGFHEPRMRHREGAKMIDWRFRDILFMKQIDRHQKSP
jgi:hypothetical protein